MNDRIQRIMQLKGLTASRFAELVGVTPSAITHICNGRNKPSIACIEGISQAFPDINMEWLIAGKGDPIIGEEASKLNFNVSSRVFDQKQSQNKVATIQRVVVFYTDGHFEEFYSAGETK